VTQAFGKKTFQSEPPRQSGTVTSNRSALQSGYLAVAFMAIGLIVSLDLWFYVYKMPIERPYAGLFVAQPQDREGWAPFWVPALAAMLLGLVFSLIVRSTAKSLTIIKAGMFSLLMVAIASGLTSLIKNIGFVLYYVPGAGVLDVLRVLPTMASLNMSKGILDLGFDAPELLLLAAFSAAGYAAIERLARLS
jgi:hypothetical protein